LIWNLSASELAKIVGGQVVSDTGKRFSGLGSDTRKSLVGQVFVALQGETHDAHQFLPQAVGQGAAALLVHSSEASLTSFKDQVSIVKVADTLFALQTFATWWRRQCQWKVIGITGSNGKTTTKEIAKAILSSQVKVYAHEKNFNNHWGVPFLLLDVPKDRDVVVVEMGMSGLREIERLCQIAEPDIVVCTMVGSAHIGELGSIERIAQAKQEIYLHSPHATHIFNLDNEHTMEMYEIERAKGYRPLLTFSNFRENTDIQLRATGMNLTGLTIEGHIQGVKGKAEVPIIGRHNVVNIGAAVGCALACGMNPTEIWQAMQKIQIQNWGRNELTDIGGERKVLFDAYNANPESMAALIRNIFEISVEGKKIAVLGEMLELGSVSNQAHTDLGEMVGNTDIEVVWFLGEHAPQFEAGLKRVGFQKTYFISDTYEEDLALKIGSMIQPSDIVVIKGSRGMRLERVVQAWKPKDLVASSS
jgi:UDP-N-acetylmuramoyl-tripeptide--D-alanyl-D-alanine ligase